MRLITRTNQKQHLLFRFILNVRMNAASNKGWMGCLFVCQFDFNEITFSIFFDFIGGFLSFFFKVLERSRKLASKVFKIEFQKF